MTITNQEAQEIAEALRYHITPLDESEMVRYVEVLEARKRKSLDLAKMLLARMEAGLHATGGLTAAEQHGLVLSTARAMIESGTYSRDRLEEVVGEIYQVASRIKQ